MKISERSKKQWENGTFKWKDNWTGKKHKEETKKLIGEKNSINQLGNKNSQFGTCWITNGNENKKIKKDNEIPNGWKIGRKIL